MPAKKETSVDRMGPNEQVDQAAEHLDELEAIADAVAWERAAAAAIADAIRQTVEARPAPAGAAGAAGAWLRWARALEAAGAPPEAAEGPAER